MPDALMPGPLVPEPTPPPRSESLVLTYCDALREALREEMQRDPDVFLIGEDIGPCGGQHRVTEGLQALFGPGRVIDSPIAELGFTGVAVGAAMAGMKPVVEYMSWSFALQAIDQIVNTAAKTRYMSGGNLGVPIVLRGPDGPATRLGAQHSQSLASWLAHVPGLKVVAPSNPADAKGLLLSAMRDPDPVAVLEHERLYGLEGPVPPGDATVPLGAAAVPRTGRDVTVVSYSYGVVLALEAAVALEVKGVSAEIVDLRTLRPLDFAAVRASLAKTRRLVVVEEGWPVCSIGAEVCARAATECFGLLSAAPVRLSGADVPMPYAANLEALALPTPARIVAAAEGLCYRSPVSSD